MTVMFFVFERRDQADACVIRLDTSYIQHPTAENIAMNIVARAQSLLGARRALAPLRALRCIMGFESGQVIDTRVISEDEIWEWTRDLAEHVYEWAGPGFKDRRDRHLPWKTVRRMSRYEQRAIMLMGAASAIIKDTLRRAGVAFEERAGCRT